MQIAMEHASDVATTISVVVGLTTLIAGLISYRRQCAQHRGELLIRMRERFEGNESFKRICVLLETDHADLAQVPYKDKRELLGFFEEIALMLNSGFVRPEVARYMFGYYAMKCYESKNFCIITDLGKPSKINFDGVYWKLFKGIVAAMKEGENKINAGSAKLKF